MKPKDAKLRVCASCEWIFLRDEDTDKNGCPKCNFGHYGARFVYGKKAYRFHETQEPWLNKKIAHYTNELMKEIPIKEKPIRFVRWEEW